MKSYRKLVLTSAICAMFAVAAQADCAADLARLEGGGIMPGSTDSSSAMPSGAVADDWTAATPTTDAGDGATTNNGDVVGEASNGATSPMAADEAAPEAGSTGDATGIAKDGSLAPLEEAPGESSDQAMSEQDAQAQQEGAPTAAGQAASTGTEDRADLIKAAKAALAAGDEAACQQAVDKALAL